ncbi:MAG: 16S rRNA (guanine(527)-N(7))-methyltransferase RsmG, partial [Terriglobales bacterium]
MNRAPRKPDRISSASFPELIERWMPEYGLVPSPLQRGLLARYLDLLAAANQRIRLVGNAEAEILVRRHLGESIYLGTRMPLAGRSLADVGSGAGFPGLALAIAFGLKTTLVESTLKKAAFLRSAIEALGLSGVEVRAEFLDPHPKRPLAADVVTVRALEGMAQVPRWLARWLRPQARAAFWV